MLLSTHYYFSVTKFAEVFYESKSAGAREKVV